MSQADFGRIIHLGKRRERAKEDIEKQRIKLEEEKKILAADIAAKFTPDNSGTGTTILESGGNDSSAIAPIVVGSGGGLVSIEEAKRAQKLGPDATLITGSGIESKVKASQQADVPVAQKRILSFNAYEDEEEEDGGEEGGGERSSKSLAALAPPFKKRSGRLGMDPTVDTSFLPDAERELQVARRKEELAEEWRQLQDKEKNEEINVAFAYWDGSSHRRDTKMKKGATIAQFLQKALENLRKEFPELKTAGTESMMFIKEDLIIPHFYTFLDFIATRAVGKTGPLWEFDAIGEIRVRQDAALDAGESHPAKVVLRAWYEKNKHIYPASRWEAFIPNKEYKRTIDDLSTI